MKMFASKVTREVTLDGGERVVIRKLNHASLDRAREAQSSKGARSLRDFGGEIVKVLRSEEFVELKTKKAEDPDAPRKARYAAFDRGVVLTAGIQSWTAEVKLSAEAIQDLDDATAQRLHEEIIDLSLPPLDPKAAEEKEKNA
jgi:hypothetical protein